MGRTMGTMNGTGGTGSYLAGPMPAIGNEILLTLLLGPGACSHPAHTLLTPCSPCLPVYIPRSLLHLFTPQHCDSRIHKWTDPWGTGNWWTTDRRQLLVLLGVLVNSVSSQFSLPSLCHFCRGSLRRVSLVPALNRTSHVGRTCLLYQLRITSSPFPSFCSSSFF